MEWPPVSIIISTYNCRSIAERCVKSILKQDYPKDKIEIIAVDSYSTDGTIETLEKLGAKFIFTKERYPEGEGKAKWLGYRKSSSNVIIYTDSDTMLIETDWIKNMVFPLINSSEISLSISRMRIIKNDKTINKYLSIVGTDPFLIYESFDPLLALGKLKLEDEGRYFTYTLNLRNFVNVGSYSMATKKEILDRIGGYTHDVEVSYRLAKNNIGRIAIPKNTTIHHLISDSIIKFTKKKYWWANVYFETQRYYKREFSWMQSSIAKKIKLVLRIIKNFMFIPQVIIGIKMATKSKEPAWLLHPVMVWLTSAAYLSSYIKNDFFKLKRKPDMGTHQVILENGS